MGLSNRIRVAAFAAAPLVIRAAPGSEACAACAGASRVLKSLVLSLVFLMAMLLFSQTDAWSQTPASQPKSCNYSGGTACPPVPPVTGSWQYTVDPHYGATAPNATFHSFADINNWYTGTWLGNGSWCSATLTGEVEGPNEWGSVPDYRYGIVYQDSYTFDYNIVEYASPVGPPPYCVTNWTSSADVLEYRSVACPAGDSVTYSTSPLTGPYCTLPSATPNQTKQPGQSCPSGCGNDGSTNSNSGAADSGSGSTVVGGQSNVSSGNLYQSETDYVGGGTNPLRFARSYNSLPAYTNWWYATTPAGQYIGSSWTATYFQYLVPVSVTDSTTTYNSVYAYRPDGRMIVFSESSSGVYSPDGDVSDSLMQTDTGWEYQTAQDTLETYNTNGQLVSIAPRGKAPITVSRANAGDPPSSVSDAFGHTLAFTYGLDSSGTQRLMSVQDPAGSTIQYAYDSYGNLITVTYQDLTTRQYSYLATGGSGHALQTLTDEAGTAYASWTYNYYYNNTVLSSQLAGGVSAYSFSYSLSGGSGSVAVTDPLGQSRTYNQQLIWGTYRMTGSTALCPACSEDKARGYDANGNITSRTDFNSNVTNYSYDVTRNLETSRTEAYGTSSARTISTAWDTNWRQPDSVTEPNRTTAFTYDSMGNVLTKTVTDTTVLPNVSRTWTYTYDSYGRMLTAKGPRTDLSSTTTYTYYTCTTGTQCGQLHTVTDPVGNVTTYNTYNVHGQPLTITDPNSVVTTLTYDSRLRLTSRQVGSETTGFSYYATGMLKRVTLPDSSYVQYTYDGAHRLTQIADGAGNSIQYTLDNMGNRTAERTYDPSSTLHRTHTRVFTTLNQLYKDVNAAGTSVVTTAYAYDSNGNQTSISAPLSRSTANAYDTLNRLGQITDPASGNTYFTYDAENDLTSVKDPLGLTTSYSYNGFGDVTALSSPDTGSTTSTYDSGGNLSTSTDARGAVAAYAYDSANRVTSIAYSLSGTTDQTLAFAYDSGTYGKGRLTSASDANHSLAWTYDGLGRVTGKGLTVGSVSLSVGYGYTSGDRTSLVTPSGQSVTYGFNSNHQVTSIAVNGTNVLTSVTYEPFGGVNSWTWGDGSTTSRTFNADGLISQIVTAGVTLGYSFDNANRITGISDSSNSALTWSYGYDLLDRLTSATTSAITDGWTYDANGNQLTQTGSNPETFSVSSSSNQLTSTSGTFARTYGFDSAGHATSYGGLSFSYNDRGRMRATSADSTDYLYNALGQMFEKSGTLGTTIFMQDEAGHLIGEYDGSGNLIEETVWLGEIPVATIAPNGSSVNIFYVHTDHLNSPRKVAQPTTGTLAWRWDADPFGTAAPNQNPGGLGTFVYNLRAPGQYYQAETGLNQNWNRDYDPLGGGRYIESDPLLQLSASFFTRPGTLTKLLLRNPQLLGSYTYVGDSPISRRDPMGMLDVPAEIVPYFPPLPPWNGNIWPGFTEQDGVCTLPGCIGRAANANPPILACCQTHDACYSQNRCNASSWLLQATFSQSCQQCNAAVMSCIVPNLVPHQVFPWAAYPQSTPLPLSPVQ